MIKLSMKVIARYLLANPSDRHEVLRKQKYQAPESLARARFYSEARTVIVAYHRGDVSRGQVEARIAMLRAQAKGASRFVKTEITSNAEVLERYLADHGHRQLTLSSTPTLDLVRSEVRITTRPTMFAIEDEVRRLIFLELGVSNDRGLMRLISQLAYEVASPVMRNLPLRAIQVIDVRGGVVIELDRRAASLGADLAAACKAISTQWPTIEPPVGWRQADSASERQLPMEWHPEP